jgi:hypothetical protein
MDTETSIESSLIAEVEALRRRFPDTKDLYREVAIMLFFRYGQTPTTNRLYQLVRKGSMNTVTAALAGFWETLRTRSRVQVEHPDLPDPLKVAAGDLVKTLWEHANSEAKVRFDLALSEAERRVGEFHSATEQAERANRELTGALSDSQSRLGILTEELRATIGALNTEKSGHLATEARLDESRLEVESLRGALAEARRDFAAELSKSRESMALSEDRLASAERRALLEIEHERSLRLAVEAETQRLHGLLHSVESQANLRLEASATEIGDLRGRLSASEAALAKVERALSDARVYIGELEAKSARSEGEVQASKNHIGALELALKSSTGRARQSAKVQRAKKS